MHQTTGIQTGQDDPENTAPILNPSPKGVTAVNAAKKLSATLNRSTRQPLMICSSTKVPVTFHVPPISLNPKLPATLNPKPTGNTAGKGSTSSSVTKPSAIPNLPTIFGAPNNNNIGLANHFKAKLPVIAHASTTLQIITSQPIPTVSATIKRPLVFSPHFSLPTSVTTPKRYSSPLKRPANINNAKNLINACQCQCNKKKHLINTQTNTGEYSMGIVIKDSKFISRKRSSEGKDEGPPSKKILDEDGEICPVCLESCTNSGDHRLVALKCGHLFGANCIQTWLRGNKKCPTCQRRAILPDLRNIYARKLAGPDPVEKPGVRSIGVRAVKRSRRRRRRQIVNTQATDQCTNAEMK